MSLFKDMLEGFAEGVLSVASNGRTTGKDQGAHGLQIIQSCCAQLGWNIDERVGSMGFVLHFNDPLVGTRKLLITVGESGRIATFAVFSAAQLPLQQIAPEILSFLLRRNNELVFGAWGLSPDSAAPIVLEHGLLTAGLNAGAFKALCETMCEEVHAFDSKLRQAGVLQPVQGGDRYPPSSPTRKGSTMSESSLEIARSVADAGALYAERRWMQGEADATKDMWRGRLYDTIFAGVLHAIELYERALSRRQKRRRSMLLLWCLKCRARLKVPRGLKHGAVKCPTCGNVQTAPGQSRN